MNRARRWLGAGGILLLAVAGVVYVVGAQLAGRTCIEDGADILVPQHLLVSEPEGYGAEIPREGTCRITHDGETYREVPLSRWDLTEGAVALAAVGGLLGLTCLIAPDRISPRYLRPRP